MLFFVKNLLTIRESESSMRSIFEPVEVRRELKMDINHPMGVF